MAHSAYPELGESAIDKLLSVLDRIRHVELPVDALLGPSTLNIGTISGGRAPNIIADQRARGNHDPAGGRFGRHKEAIAKAVAGCAEAREVLEDPPSGWAVWMASRQRWLPTTDIPAFGGAWQPFLIGPGTFMWHTPEERVPKRQLVEAVEIYQRMVKQLWKQESKSAS